MWKTTRRWVAYPNDRCIVRVVNRKGHTMIDIIEAIAVTCFFIGLLLAANEDTSKIYVNFIGAGLALFGMLILHVTGKDV